MILVHYNYSSSEILHNDVLQKLTIIAIQAVK